MTVKAHVIQLGTPNPSHYHDHGDVFTNPGNYVTGGLVGPGFVSLSKKKCLWGRAGEKFRYRDFGIYTRVEFE